MGENLLPVVSLKILYNKWLLKIVVKSMAGTADITVTFILSEHILEPGI
jgi:hypothetical protein